jgi:hypothetical protein
MVHLVPLIFMLTGFKSKHCEASSVVDVWQVHGIQENAALPSVSTAVSSGEEEKRPGL